MAITRWDPFRELEDMSGRLNRLFARTDLRSPNELLRSVDFAPPVDISENAEAYLVKAEIPEMKREDIKVSLDAGVLSISGERKQEREEKSKTFHRIERAYGTFLRSFQLPEAVDSQKVSAEYKDGVLSVRVPKTERAVPKTVDIKVG